MPSKSLEARLFDMPRNRPDEAAELYLDWLAERGAVPPEVVERLAKLQDDIMLFFRLLGNTSR